MSCAPREREEVPMPIVGGLDIHRKQITFDYLDTETGQVKRGQVSPADRAHLRAWLARVGGREVVGFAGGGGAGGRGSAAAMLDPAVPHPGVPGAAGDLP